MSDIMKMGKNPNYLGSWDLEELPNREVILTIDHITDEKVVTAGQSEICTVCYWTDNAFNAFLKLSDSEQDKVIEKARGSIRWG